MKYTINYITTRSDLYRWYWRIWKAYLWKIHLLLIILATLSIGLFGFDWNIVDYNFIILGLIIAIVVLLISIIYPQIMYKPSIRELIADETGIYTVIGKESGYVSWEEIRNIEVTTNNIAVIGKTYNAFIIPIRAFENDEKRQEFITTIKRWHREGK